MFEDAESQDVGRAQELKELFYEGFVTPAKIAMSDWRTLSGLLILGLFLLTALIVVLHKAGFEWFNAALNAVGSPWEFGKPNTAFGCNEQGVNCDSGYKRRREPFVNWETPLGTDGAGRDLLSGVLWGTPYMLKMVTAGGVFAMVLATAVGTVAGYKGGLTKDVLMTLTDIAMSIPGLPLVIVLIAIFDPSSPLVVGILITINVWTGLARSIEAQVLSIREHSYVEASRTMGVRTPSIIQKDILPNLMPYIMVNFVYASRRVIYDSVGLFFLGFLSVNTVANWGVMMNLAYDNNGALNQGGPRYMIIVPMVPIVLLSLGLILLSQGTDRLFNPRVRTRQEGETVEEDHEDDDVQPAMM